MMRARFKQRLPPGLRARDERIPWIQPGGRAPLLALPDVQDGVLRTIVVTCDAQSENVPEIHGPIGLVVHRFGRQAAKTRHLQQPNGLFPQVESVIFLNGSQLKKPIYGKRIRQSRYIKASALGASRVVTRWAFGRRGDIGKMCRPMFQSRSLFGQVVVAIVVFRLYALSSV